MQAATAKSVGPTTVVSVDDRIRYQTIEGFGASTSSAADCGNDKLGAMRPKVLDAVYNQVKLTMGDIHAMPYEGYFSPPTSCGWDALVRSNDNDDPFTFDWTHFQWGWRSDYDKTALVDIARPLGFDNFMLRGAVSTRWADQWLNQIRSKHYKLYLQEAAENVVAIYVHWRDAYGIVPAWDQPFNEPLSGNNEVFGGTTEEIVDLVKTIGARFRAEGFNKIRLVVPSETNEQKSLDTAEAILNDRKARQYVGAIGYHPYGSAYSEPSSILATSGAGHPDQRQVEVREQIRKLAEKYGLQTWMTEVCCGGGNIFDALRARAIHIHDELVYADASSYWGMYNMTDRAVEGNIVTYDGASQTFNITGMGYAIGHYARWIKKGTVRIEARSSDSLLLVTAFQDVTESRVVLVIINNARTQKTLDVRLNGLTLTGSLTGEQSASVAFWQPLAGFAPTSASSFTITVPGLSVTTISSHFLLGRE